MSPRPHAVQAAPPLASHHDAVDERPATVVAPYWEDRELCARLFHGDSLEVLAALPGESVDLVFADPPYFLSNGGFTCQAGRRVAVHKGGWDKSRGADANHEFNRAWLEACRHVMRPDASIFVSGTSHVIFSVGFAMQQLGFKILNQITWEKPNPPPNLSCRYFTHSTETILWAARTAKSRHCFQYATMRGENGGKQMKDVWRMPAPGKLEKAHGRHPTQKPRALLDRVIRCASLPGQHVLDPFNGSGTTAVSAVAAQRAYVGVDLDEKYLELTKRRLADLRRAI